MNLTRCSAGHFYDADKHSVCPHCNETDTIGTGTMPTCYGTQPMPYGGTQTAYSTDTLTPRRTAEKYYNVLSDFESCKNVKDPFIFISYAHADAERIRPFFEILEKNNFRYWYDEGLPSGEDFSGQIGRHIKCAVQFILFLSKNSQKSEYVKNELHIATKYEKNILVVYIEELELDDDLELKIDRKQNLHAYRYSTLETEKKFYRDVSKDALKKCVSDECECSAQSKKAVEDELSSRYRDITPITKSRMNEIYSAVNVNTGCKVIIKKTIYDGSHNRDFFYKCFLNEKRTLETCQCPFIPQLYDSFESESNSYIVETYLHGESPVQQGAYSEDFVIALGIRIAHILKYFYYHGIVHCDIKPSNIIVNELGDVFLIDFGSCVFISDKDKDEMNTGTQGFAAPEQFGNGLHIDYRTDIYSLGRTMLTLLVGDKISSQNALADRRSAMENISVTCALNIPTVKPQYITESLDYYDKSANSELTRIINKMVSPQKENRYFSLDQLISELENCKRKPF